jgi:hypothetical protein
MKQSEAIVKYKSANLNPNNRESLGPLSVHLTQPRVLTLEDYNCYQYALTGILNFRTLNGPIKATSTGDGTNQTQGTPG